MNMFFDIKYEDIKYEDIIYNTTKFREINNLKTK